MLSGGSSFPGKCVEAVSEPLTPWYECSDGVVSEEFATTLACDLSLADERPFSSLRSILEASESLLDLGSEPTGDNRRNCMVYFEPGFRPRRCFSNIQLGDQESGR